MKKDLDKLETADEAIAKNPEAPTRLDTRKLLCPLPVIRLQQAIHTLPPGARLVVLASDKGVLYDIPAWCRIHGHSVIEIKETTEGIHIEVCKNVL